MDAILETPKIRTTAGFLSSNPNQEIPTYPINFFKKGKKTYNEVREIDDGPGHARRATKDRKNNKPKKEQY